MEIPRSTSRLATRAMKSVVVVMDKEHAGDYCSGSVVVNYRRTDAGTGQTLVVAPTRFVKGKKDISVAFFDGVQSSASVVSEEEHFSLLSTAAHSKCEAVNLLEEFNASSFLPRPTFVLAPISSRQTKYVATYATLESLESYTVGGSGGSPVKSSSNYFLFTCDFIEKTHSGKSRLAASPVFIRETPRLNGLAMGFVLQETQNGNEQMMVGVTSTKFKEILSRLDPPPLPRKPRLLPQKRGGGDGQKRGRGGKRGRSN